MDLVDRWQRIAIPVLLRRWPHKDAIDEVTKRELGQLRVRWYQEAAPVDQVAQKVGEEVDRFSSAEQARLFGIPTKGLLPGEIVQDFRARNVKLVKRLADDQHGRLTEILDKADAGALRVEEVTKQIQEAFDISKRHAELIAVDQTLTLNAQIVQQRQADAGITRYLWKTSEDERVRPEHADLDGTEHDWSDPPTFEDGTSGHPGEPIRCRCQAIPVIPWLADDS